MDVHMGREQIILPSRGKITLPSREKGMASCHGILVVADYYPGDLGMREGNISSVAETLSKPSQVCMQS